VYVYSADYQPTFSVYLSHAGGLTADQLVLIFEVDQPYRDIVADVEISHNFADQPVGLQPTL